MHRRRGNWHSDTLTEDLDLSYRAQLRGWKFKFLKDVTSPAELPSEINALKTQQFRWTKGAIETARKMLPAVWKSDLPFKIKWHSTLRYEVCKRDLAVNERSLKLINSSNNTDLIFFRF